MGMTHQNDTAKINLIFTLTNMHYYINYFLFRFYSTKMQIIV